MDEKPVAADDFRIENQVFAGRTKEPASRSTTIFCDDVVYDYLEPSEVIIFDKAAGRFTLLDTARRIRTEVRCQEVTSFTERLQLSAAAADDPFLLFLASPKFDEQFDKASRELTLSSSWMTYRLSLVDVGSEIAGQYRESCDWYAKLNTLLHPGSKPPFARLLVNAGMARYKGTAKEVFLTLTPKKTFPPQRIKRRSQHELVRQLTQSDRERVAQTRQFMTIFKWVGFEEFRKRE